MICQVHKSRTSVHVGLLAYVTGRRFRLPVGAMHCLSKVFLEMGSRGEEGGGDKCKRALVGYAAVCGNGNK